MTRDEAICKVLASNWRQDCHGAPQLVDAFVALGMLKLDEPKSMVPRICEAFRNCRELDDVAPAQVVHALDLAGLKIVEK